MLESEHETWAIKWTNGQKLISRARELAPEDREYFYSVNKYVRMAHEEYSPWVAEVDQAPKNRGIWRKTMGLSRTSPLDLEIGTGNGYFFEHLAREYPSRGLIGLELKYKPLVQTVKRTQFTGHKAFRILRYDAKHVTDIFAPLELNNVFIYFPDPWEKRAQSKHRLINSDFLKTLHVLQKPGSVLKFKTDSEVYYKWVCEHLTNSPYKLVAKTDDLHSTEWARTNFQTHFERLWTKKGRKTHFIELNH